MTRDEAIAYGRRVIDLGLNDETQAFCELVIKALEQQANTELIIKTTIKEYLDKFYLDTNELLIDLNHDLCKRIRCKEAEK